MASALSLRNTADRLLRKYNATDRVVFKRTFVRVGGDPLIGRSASVSSQDNQLDPQPAVSFPKLDPPVVVGSRIAQAGDYLLLTTPTALSKEDLQNPDLVIVFSDGTNEEVTTIQSYEPYAMGGIVVAYNVLVRSKKQ